MNYGVCLMTGLVGTVLHSSPGNEAGTGNWDRKRDVVNFAGARLPTNPAWSQYGRNLVSTRIRVCCDRSRAVVPASLGGGRRG